jgi:hypothetical protein
MALKENTKIFITYSFKYFAPNKSYLPHLFNMLFNIYVSTAKYKSLNN